MFLNKLSRIQQSYVTSSNDITNWPYPMPITYAGPSQFRRAKKLLSLTYNLTKDFRSYCLILSKKGKWTNKIYWSEL